MKALRFMILPLLAAGVGCGEPAHLQYDYGRSYSETFAVQADRTRPSIADSEYSLTGVEGLELRQRVQDATTDEEQGMTVQESEEQ